MNVALLNKVKAHILEEPKRLDMKDWLFHMDPGLYPERAPKCGTVGCIAGWACVLAGHPDTVGSYSAQNFLGINEAEASRLFYRGYWPARFNEPYTVAHIGSRERAQITADRIDHFIATNGLE